MSKFLKILSSVLALSIISTHIFAANIIVNSQSSFNNAQNSVNSNDTITWEAGTYADIEMDISISNITVRANKLGKTIFSGSSKAELNGDYITFEGFQFIGGNIGTSDVLKSYGNYNIFTQINIQDYTSYKYLVIQADCQYNTVSYCNFENRLNLDDKNILSVLVHESNPGYHIIKYCSFKNFDGTGGDMGIEPIRIGLSTQGEFISRTTVEYCYFTQCNGDGEIISNKAKQNVFRYNTFEDNPLGELVLRHGDQGTVYSNFFINNMGGIRVREGQRHYIYNNYFSGNTQRSIYLQDGDSDPLDTIVIAFNTFVKSEEIILGGDDTYSPQHVTLANNIFTESPDNIFSDASGDEQWIGNIYTGTLGITKPDGLTEQDPKLSQNSSGYYELSDISPAIDAALAGYPDIPNYEGLDIDHTIIFDLMQQLRDSAIVQKDLGCSEYSQNIQVKPLVNEGNTGPSYFWGVQKMNLEIETEGEGSIQLDPPSGVYDSGTVVTITAIPNDGYLFKEWSIDLSDDTNPQTILMDAHKTVKALFVSDDETGLGDNILDEMQIQIFPNPVNNELFITLKQNKSENIELEIYNLIGKHIKTITIDSPSLGDTTISCDVSELKHGVYFLHLTSSNLNNNKIPNQLIKFIKQ